MIFNLPHLRSVTFLLTAFCFVQTIVQAQSVKLYKIAHRGGFVNSDTPENTITSLNQAIEKNYSYVEVDVRMTMDDVLIYLHDEKLNVVIRELQKMLHRNGSAVNPESLFYSRRI